jgi:hypothetical protein
MANTLAEYKYIGPAAEIRAGIAKTIVTESPWLQVMPFVEINNNVSRYKMETVAAAANSYAVGDTWIEGAPQWEYRDAPLAILGGDADVDNFGELAAGPQDNVMAAVTELKSKAIAQYFEKLAIYGRTTANASLSSENNFKGLLRLIAEAESSSTTDLDGATFSSYGTGGNNPQVVDAAASASATLSLDMIDVLLDVVKPKPTHIICSRAARRKIGSLARSAGENVEHDKNQLGFPVTRWGEQILLIDDALLDNMDDPSSNVTAIASYDYTGSSDTLCIFAVRFGEDGLCGINGNGMIQIEKFDKLETKDAKRVRIKFYAGMRLTNKKAAGVLLAATTS